MRPISGRFTQGAMDLSSRNSPVETCGICSAISIPWPQSPGGVIRRPKKRCILLKRSERENTGAKPTAPPRLPPEAEQEILEALFEGMEIHSSEIAAILKKHGVCGDVEALQDSYRKRLGQRLMASLRDEGGKREVLANGKGSYVVLEGCGDRRQLKQIRRRIQNQMKGLDLSARKVSGRLTVLERLARKWRRAG